MATTVTVKGQVTIPKKVRDSLNLTAGDAVAFAANADGEIVVRKVGGRASGKRDRFDLVRGTATIPWRTDELMALLRGVD